MTSAPDLFEEMNNAVLDLQTAGSQSYARPIKRLGRLIQHEDLAERTQALIKDVDFDAFMAASEATQGGMIGSAELQWPDDDREILGLQYLFILKFAENPEFMEEIGRYYFYSTNKISSAIRSVTSEIVIPFVRDFKNYILNAEAAGPRLIMPITKKIFIVHGHDGEARETVARFLSKIGFEPIILHEQANRGRTVIEKVEANADVSFAVVLLTPDDLGRSIDATELEPRARQNVLLELGYFIARLGRDRVCALKRGTVSIPSDFAGVVWEEMDSAGGWQQKLARELQAAGHTVDWNKVMQ